MTVLLSPDDVASKLNVSRKTAISLMYTMRYTVIGGNERKRIRVSENAFDAWVEKRSAGKPVKAETATGTKRRLGRR